MAERPTFAVRLRGAWLLAPALLAVPSPTFAQDATQSAAQALFEEGRTLLLAERVAEACPKLAESQRVEPAPGTLLNLAICHEKQGKTATAYLEYNDLRTLAAQTGDSERGRIARQRIEFLQPLLARLDVRLPDQTPRDAWVSIDGAQLELSAFSAPIPVDPGEHLIGYGAPGMRSIVRSVAVAEPSSVVTVELPALEPEMPRIVAPTAVTARNAAAPPHSALPHENDAEELRWLAIGGSLAIGVAGLAFGTYFGLDAHSEWAERNAHCHNGTCDPEAQAAGDRARTSATLSNVGFVVGIAGSVIGGYLLLSGPSTAAKTRVAGVLARDQGELRLEREF